MRKMKWKWWLSASLALLLVVLSGCQAVQGLDVGKVLVNQAAITSSESNGELTLELIPGNTASLSDDEKRLLDVLKTMKILIKEAKLQDRQHESIDAELTYGKGTVPFKLELNGEDMILQIEGAKKPLVLHNQTAAAGQAAPLFPKEVQEELSKKMADMLPSLTKFFTNNAPNPNKISVTSVSDKVYGETANLQQIHAEIYGSELLGLLKTFLTNVIADEKGLKELLGQLYDIVVPVMKESMKAAREHMQASDPKAVSDASELIGAYLDNKTLAVEFLYTSVKKYVELALQDYDNTTKTYLDSPAGAPFKVWFGDQTALKLDLFVDSNLYIRKEKLELQLPVPDEGDKSGVVSAIKLTASTECWNVNQPVTADHIDLSSGTVDIGADKPFQAYMLLNNLDKSSQAYKLLKDDLKITKKHLELIMDENGAPADDTTHPYISEDGVTMVPARFIVEQLGAQVRWNGDLKQVTVDDGYTGTQIVLQIDNKTAYVNGQAIQLESAAVLKNSTTFVPVRFITEALGGKVGWDNNTRVVSITRE